MINCLYCIHCVELGKGVTGAVGHSMLLLHHYLISWTDVSKKLCLKLFNDGHLLQHFAEIKELSNSLADDKVCSRSKITINVRSIWNTVYSISNAVGNIYQFQ